MLKGEKHDQSTQVNEHELYWDCSNTATRLKASNLNIGGDNILDLGIYILDKENFSQVLSKADNLTKANLHKPTFSIEERQKLGPEAVLEGSDKSKASEAHSEDQGAEKTKAFQLEYGVLKNFTWDLPMSIKVFLKNALESKVSIKIKPWVALKRDIIEFFGYACRNAQVQSGRVGLTTSMDELLCMYFLEVSLLLTRK